MTCAPSCLSLSHTHMLSLFLCRPTRSLSFSVAPTIAQKMWVCASSYYKMTTTRKLPKLLGLFLKTSPIFVGLFCKRDTAFFFTRGLLCKRAPQKQGCFSKRGPQNLGTYKVLPPYNTKNRTPTHLHS